MGIFDFLKRISGKEEEKREVKDIKLEGAVSLTDSFYEKMVEDINSKLVEIGEEITQEKISMENSIRELEEVKHKPEAFPERAMQIMEGNRKSYLQKTKVLLKDINPPHEFDKVLKFCNDFDDTLTKFSESTTRNYQILQQFIGGKVNPISKNIFNIKELIKQAEKLVKNSDIEKIDELKGKIKGVQEKIKHKEDLKGKIKLAFYDGFFHFRDNFHYSQLFIFFQSL